MRVHRSNRLERLVDRLVAITAEPLRSPFEPERIVVQSRGTARWLSQQIALRTGIFANVEQPFPRRFLDETIDAVLGLDPRAARFEREALGWSIAALLPELLGEPGFEPLRRYLDDDATGLKRIQLARSIADRFDQYTVYRPELVLGWDRGVDEPDAPDRWQPALWRRLVEAAGGPAHLAARSRRFLALLADAPAGALPSRVSVFGISALPPLFTSLFAALGERVPVHLFQLSPTPEWWADLRDEGDEERGPRLLESLGRVGRDAQAVLEEHEYDDDGDALYEDPGTSTLLAAIQHDLLHVRRRDDGDRLPAALARDDTLSVHACHSPLREVEVLRDRLLALLDADPGLDPADIVVLCPDVERYAPLIEAVFGAPAGTPRYVPFRIADRSLRAHGPVVLSFLRVVALLGSRFRASEVVDALASEPVARRFDFDAESLDDLRRLVADSGVRWGVDAEHRAEVGQPAIVESTWRFGLDRLLVGVAAAGRAERLFAGVLPYDEVEGDRAGLVGRLARAVEVLAGFRASARRARSLPQWRDLLVDLLDATHEPGDEAHEAQAIRDTLGALADGAEAAGYLEPLPLEAVRWLLDGTFRSERSHAGYLAGGINFGAVLPMRSIPFRVVCVLGLDDAFPRTDRRPAFDRMALHPRAGDRNLRDEDRYLFLEAILSARERLILTYVGRSQRSDQELPPSVVVSELLEAVSGAVEGESAGADLLVHHPLQPFSPRVYTASEPRLWSFDEPFLDGARVLATTEPHEVGPLVPDRIPVPADERQLLDVDELARFFQDPARGLLAARLGLRIDDGGAALEDREPLVPDPLERYQVAAPLVAHALRGGSPEELRAAVLASGELPAGVAGEAVLDEILASVDVVVRAAAAVTAGGRLPALQVELGPWDDHAPNRVTGWLHDRWPGQQVRVQYARVAARHLLDAWVRHVVLCAVPGDHARRTVLVGRAQRGPRARVVAFREVTEPSQLLRRLCALYWAGQGRPLALFPEASLAYAAAIRGGADPEDAERAAKGAWRQEAERGEWLRRVWRGSPPFGRDYAAPEPGIAFEALALRLVIGPMLDHLEG